MHAIAPTSANEGGGSTVQPVDEFVFPHAAADRTLQAYWTTNGHLYSSRYADPAITSFSALVASGAQIHGDALAYLYPAVDGPHHLRQVSFRQLDRLVSQAAAWYGRAFAREIAGANTAAAQPTLALIGVGITFDYFVAVLALLRLHVRVLLLSNKNSAVAHRYLLGACGAVGCIVDAHNTGILGSQEDGFLQSPVDLVGIAELEQQQQQQQPLVAPTDVAALAFQTSDPWTLPSVVIHSSGTTGMPKPIVHTHRSLCLIARHYRLYREFYYDNFQICAPLFHIGGLSVAISGLPIGKAGTFPPPQWPPSMTALLAGWDTARALGCAVDAAQMAPDLVEDLYMYIASTTNDFTPLSRLTALESGGAPFAPALLETLVALGINMKSVYGQTEIAGPLRTLPHGRENPSLARMRNLYQGTGWVDMQDLGSGDGVAECVVYRDYPLAAQLWDAPGAPNPYRTNDIFREDPPGSGFWVLIGRKDDVVVHSNGEKTMAGGVATLLADSGPAILNAAVFGANRPCTAAVIGIRWAAVGDADDEAVEDMVWNAVHKCNAQIPTHSRLDRSLLLILGRNEALPVTPKGSVRRTAAWEMYGAALDTLFDTFLSGQLQAGPAGTDAALDGLADADYVKACVAVVCEAADDSALLDGRSFYEVGLDSQRAVKLRALLARRFGPFPVMFIFENPTVDQLLAYLRHRRSQGGAGDEPKMAWIRSTVDTYCAEMDAWKALRETLPERALPAAGHVIYLTGANGALGNALIEVFVRDPAVARVYCAVRGSADAVPAKLAQSLVSRGYGASVAQSTKLCAVPYSMADAKLGLDDALLARLAGEVTTVLHNAWKLDFNQPVTMFAADCLRGTMNLMRFCLSGQKKTFAFTSSISTVMGPTMAGKAIQEAPVSDDVHQPAGIGYAQSKYIVERITQHFSSALAMPVRLLRVGQLCGHSELGVWNESEMWPIMIATGLDYLRGMPALGGTAVNWLPVDKCAEAAAAVVTRDHASLYTVNNLVHPRPIPWAVFLDLLAEASGRDFGRVPMPEWTAMLERLAETGSSTHVPGTKLLGYFQAMAANPDSETSDVVTATVAGLEPLNAAAVAKWLSRWQESGFVRLARPGR